MVPRESGNGALNGSLGELNCQPWQCENDAATLVLFQDLLNTGSHVSQTVYSDVSTNNARRKDFQRFCDMLQRKGVRLVPLQEVAVASSHVGAADAVDFLMDLIVCTTADESVTSQDVADFKRNVVMGMDAAQQGHAATHILEFRLARGDDGVVACESYTITPLRELLRERLQICTPKGAVLARTPRYPTKVKILERVLTRLGMPVQRILPAPLKMSGGDFIPANADLCFIGVGLGTDEAAVRLLLTSESFGTRRVAVVRDIFDRNPARQHLDTIFKIIDKDCVLALGSVLGADNLKRRLVNEYTYDEGRREYVMSRMSVEFGAYLADEGYGVVLVPDELHHETGLGVYNFGLGDLIVADARMAALLEAADAFKGTVEVHPEWTPSMFAWMCETTLVFRRTTAEAHHQPPAPRHPAGAIPRCWDTSRDSRIHQTTNTILMVAPVGFKTNAETAVDNHFMKKSNMTPDEIEATCLREFSEAHLRLTRAGVKVVLFCNERWYGTPDAVFPNNWFSTHSFLENDEGRSTVAFYPMKTESRRKERREYIISELQQVYDREMSFVQWENSDFPNFLESTGVLIMDRKRRICYIALSQRANKRIAETWGQRMGYKMVLFHATDKNGRPIYHTNVLMAVGTTVAVLCTESIDDPAEREHVVSTLRESHEIVDITRAQMDELCGNVLEVHGTPYDKRLMVMSTRAYNAFTEAQKATMLKHVTELLHTPIETIENIGGGGIRCMMGELF